MSLFEKIQNKRYDLQEGVDNKGNITSSPGDKKVEKSILRNYNKKQKKVNQTNVTSSGRVSATSDIIKSGSGDASKSQKSFANKFSPKNLSKTLSQTTSDPNKSTMISGKSDETVIRSTKPTSDEGQFRRNAKRTKITGDVIPKKNLPKTKGVNQADVSKKAQEFTKEVNKKNKNLNPPTRANYPKTKKELIAKRKEYGIDRKGNISNDGVKRYAQKTKQLSSGSNIPAKITSKDLKVAKIRAVGGEKIKDSTGKVVGTTTGKYGGKLARARNKNLPSYADVKAKIDAKNPTYKSPITGGKLPLSTRKYSSPVDKFNKMIEKGKKVDPVGTTKALQNMPNDPRVPSRVYVKTQPSKAYPQGFKMIDTKTSKTNLEIGRKISKKFVTDKELLTGEKPKTPKVEPVKKPNLFGRLKNLIKSTPKKLKKAHQWMVKDAGYRKTSGSGRLMKDTLGGIARDVNKTRHIYKNTFRGNTLKTLNKVLPGKYKALAVAAVGTSYAVDHHLRKKKKQKEAEKSTILPSGTDTSQVYSTVDAKLKLDTGKKKV